jgi:hypothetical protein
MKCAFLDGFMGGGGRGADNFVVTRGKKCVSFEGILKFRAPFLTSTLLNPFIAALHNLGFGF